VMVGKLSPDLVVIGETQGKLDALDFLRALRQVDSSTVVALGLEQQHVELDSAALAAGASVVVRRPFAPAELMSLIRPASSGRLRSDRLSLPIDLGRLKVDVSAPRIWLDGVEIMLPHMEFRLLRYLSERQGEIVPRLELELAAWGDSGPVRSNSLSVHIARLRRRFEGGVDTDWICSVRGFGYRLLVPGFVDRPRPGSSS
jgi:DNA-binding response OmpR family regulator